MTDETVGRVVIPTAVEERIARTVKKRGADKFGGFTTYTADGGWVDNDGNLVEETVEIIEFAGAGETFVQSTAAWIQEKSDETAVMWSVSDETVGFEG